jgi:hypothetical protein
MPQDRSTPDPIVSHRAVRSEPHVEGSRRSRGPPAQARSAAPRAAAVGRGRHRYRHRPEPARGRTHRRRSRRAPAIVPQRLSSERQPQRAARPSTGSIENFIQSLFVRLLLEVGEQVLLQGLPSHRSASPQHAVDLGRDVLNLNAWHESTLAPNRRHHKLSGVNSAFLQTLVATDGPDRRTRQTTCPRASA